jgi:hypothetical protein
LAGGREQEQEQEQKTRAKEKPKGKGRHFSKKNLGIYLKFVFYLPI